MPSTSDRAIAFPATGAVRLGGLLGDALDANRLGRLSTFITDETSPAIALFGREQVAENDEGDWYGEHAGKWLVAATRAAMRAGDADLLSRARRVADWLIAQQAVDGYLGNYAPARRFTVPQPPKPESWDGAPALRTWDIWTHTYLILGLVELWRASDEERYLTAARRIGDLAWRTLHDGAVSIIDLGNHFGLSATVLLDGAMELWEATGEETYRELGEMVVAAIEAEPRNRLVGMALADADPSEIATGKAYQLLWNLVGLAKLYRATGEPRYLAAVRAQWTAVRDRHLTLGGGPWGGVAHRSREVFNAAGAWSPEGYVETCSVMAWIQLNRELLGILGDAAFAQEIERSAYNDLLGAQSADGEDWCYYQFANGRRTHTTYWRCCKSSGAMALEELPPVAYGVTRDGAAAVNLLGAGRAVLDLPGVGPVGVEQEGAYPYPGPLSIRVEVAGKATFALAVRVPDWATEARLTVDGEEIAAPPGRYTRIERRWQSGDVVTLHLPMPAIVHHARQHNVQESRAPGGEAVAQEVLRRDWMAVTRGPLVYATELIDGYKRAETVRFAGEEAVTVEGDAALLVHPAGRPPIRFTPWYLTGGRHDGSWRLTWLETAPPVTDAA